MGGCCGSGKRGTECAAAAGEGDSESLPRKMEAVCGFRETVRIVFAYVLIG